MFASEYRMRELRYTGRNSPDIWASRSSTMGHTYRSIYPAIFCRGRLPSDNSAGEVRRVKNASYFARLYLCLPYISRTLDLSPAFVSASNIPIYVCRSINSATILTSLLPFVLLEIARELFSVGILRVRVDSCPI